MMKKSILLFAFLFTQLIFGQLRKTYTEIHNLYPDAKSKGLRTEGSFLAEDLILSKDENKFIIFDKDSIAIGVANSKNIGFNEVTFKSTISNEVPNFKVSKTAQVNNGFYYYDAVNNYLIITNEQTEKDKFPIKSFMIIIEPIIINAWTEKITNWE